MQPGSEVQAANIYYNGQPFPYTSDWFRYAIYNDPSWDPYTINAADYAYSAAKNPSNIETWDLLEGFKAMGGKLLMYHGQMDAVISSDNSPRYYEHVSKGMNLSPTELDDFFRFFRIGGMGHCSGGDGAWAIGQTNNGNAGLEPGKNVLMAVVKWVEDGTAPEGVLGTKWVGDKKGNAVQFERVHCKYPLRNHYKGGDATKKESWECIV